MGRTEYVHDMYGYLMSSIVDTPDPPAPPLPHFVPNAGLRLSAAGQVFTYTGDTGPSPDIVDLARGADLFLAEATYPERVPDHSARFLSSARQAGGYADRAGVGRLVLTHLWPGTDPEVATAAAGYGFGGRVDVARAGMTFDLGR